MRCEHLLALEAWLQVLCVSAEAWCDNRLYSLPLAMRKIYLLIAQSVNN